MLVTARAFGEWLVVIGEASTDDEAFENRDDESCLQLDRCQSAFAPNNPSDTTCKHAAERSTDRRDPDIAQGRSSLDLFQQCTVQPLLSKLEEPYDSVGGQPAEIRPERANEVGQETDSPRRSRSEDATVVHVISLLRDAS